MRGLGWLALGLFLGIMVGGGASYLVANASLQPRLESLQSQVDRSRTDLSAAESSARQAQVRADDLQKQAQSLQNTFKKAQDALTVQQSALQTARTEFTCCFDIAEAAILNYKDIKPYTGKLYDAHHHYLGNEFASLDNYAKALDAAGIDKVVLLWGPGATPLPASIAQRHSDRFIPFSTWSFAMRDFPTAYRSIDEIRSELRSRFFQGVGEVVSRGDSAALRPPGPLTANVAPDDPRLLQIVDMAAELGAPVMVRAGHPYSDEFERLVSRNRRTPIIWSHAGEPRDQYPPSGYTSVEKIRALLPKHSNLYVDLSGGLLLVPPAAPDSLVNPDGTIRQSWKDLLQEFPDRLVVGLDVGPDPAQVKKAATYLRLVLGQLPPALAERLAYKNIEALVLK
ncbi:MAG: amidohydrolase family protein [Chloroflexi bacterium]|nr:amidohydrolase family protein [Chloroflexota bacterium]